MDQLTQNHLLDLVKTSEAKPKIYILHENQEWISPLQQHLDSMQVPYEDWFVNEGNIDLNKVPPTGVFYNKMSASSHTRDHRYAADFAGIIYQWLTSHNRRIVNTHRALQLELRKTDQHLALQAHGIKTPRTIAAIGKEAILDAAQHFGEKPFILKPNRGGKGTGVILFNNPTELSLYLEQSPVYSLDGITLLQEYIQSPDKRITRMEFIAGKLYYAVSVDTSEGFELCPADACEIVPPSTEDACIIENSHKFKIIESFSHPIVEKCESFLAANGIEIAGIEFIKDASGQEYVYDINTNTNYNSKAEALAQNQFQGWKAVAGFLSAELSKIESST